MPPSESPQHRVPHVSPLRHGFTQAQITPKEAPAYPPGQHVLLYDGLCGLCQHTVRWLLRHDPEGRLLFAPQQGALAAEVLARHPQTGVAIRDQGGSAVLVSNFGRPQESLTLHSDAMLGCLTVLGGAWDILARVARLVPRTLRNLVYRWLARNRIRLFGSAELCALPTPAERARFLGI